MANIVTSTGSFGAYIINPLLAGMTIRGLAADSVFVEAVQSNDNARRVLLTSGGTTLLTNTARNGILTFRVARFSTVMYSGDLVIYCSYLQQIGQATGSQITTYYDINGITEIIAFLNCGLIKCEPLKLSGSDVQIYEISFAYSDFIRS